MNTLLIYCAGGFGKEVMDVARRASVSASVSTSRWEHIHFLDDVCIEEERYGARVLRLSNLPEDLDLSRCEAVIATGEPTVREKLLMRLDAAGIPLGRVVDVSTLVSPTARIEPGVVVTPFCSISSDAVLARNSSVNTMSIIGHDVFIGENTVVSSMVNMGGACRVGRNSYIGMGAKVREGLTIGDEVIIGMGAVVMNDIPAGVIALGNPARPMRENVDKKVFR